MFNHFVLNFSIRNVVFGEIFTFAHWRSYSRGWWKLGNFSSAHVHCWLHFCSSLYSWHSGSSGSSDSALISRLFMQKAISLQKCTTLSITPITLRYIYTMIYIIVMILYYIIHAILILLCMCRYGPPSRFWCMRFEAKSSYFKWIAQAIGNFKNIAKTVAVHHERLNCYNLLDDNLFLKAPITTGQGMYMQYVLYFEFYHTY